MVYYSTKQEEAVAAEYLRSEDEDDSSDLRRLEYLMGTGALDVPSLAPTAERPEQRGGMQMQMRMGESRTHLRAVSVGSTKRTVNDIIGHSPDDHGSTKRFRLEETGDTTDEVTPVDPALLDEGGAVAEGGSSASNAGHQDLSLHGAAWDPLPFGEADVYRFSAPGGSVPTLASTTATTSQSFDNTAALGSFDSSRILEDFTSSFNVHQSDIQAASASDLLVVASTLAVAESAALGNLAVNALAGPSYSGVVQRRASIVAIPDYDPLALATATVPLIAKKRRPQRAAALKSLGRSALEDDSDEEAGDSAVGVGIRESDGVEGDILLHPRDGDYRPKSKLGVKNLAAEAEKAASVAAAATAAALVLASRKKDKAIVVVDTTNPVLFVNGGISAKLMSATWSASPGQPHPCPHDNCDKTFARKSDFLRHYRIHTGERPFVCSVEGCGSSFIQKSALTVHGRTHTGDKPHTCDTCQRSFADSSSLGRHLKSHEGLKPFLCSICKARRFSRNATRTKHEASCDGTESVKATRGTDKAAGRGRGGGIGKKRTSKARVKDGEEEDEDDEDEYEDEDGSASELLDHYATSLRDQLEQHDNANSAVSGNAQASGSGIARGLGRPGLLKKKPLASLSHTSQAAKQEVGSGLTSATRTEIQAVPRPSGNIAQGQDIDVRATPSVVKARGSGFKGPKGRKGKQSAAVNRAKTQDDILTFGGITVTEGETDAISALMGHFASPANFGMAGAEDMDLSVAGVHAGLDLFARATAEMVAKGAQEDEDAEYEDGEEDTIDPAISGL